MNGPQHYTRAEDLLQQAAKHNVVGDTAEDLAASIAQRDHMVSAAQAHATLAAVALEARRQLDERDAADDKQWLSALDMGRGFV